MNTKFLHMLGRHPQQQMPMPQQQMPQQQMPMLQRHGPQQSQRPSIFNMIRPPQQQPQFDVQAARGTKPGNYRPTAITMSNTPMPAVFSLMGRPQPANTFEVTPASGTRPGRYTPTQISMNAPSPAGPAAMQQMLAMMGGGFGATPFAPFGQGQG